MEREKIGDIFIGLSFFLSGKTRPYQKCTALSLDQILVKA